VQGGASVVDNFRFLKALLGALKGTVENEDAFRSFAEHVLKEHASPNTRDKLRKDVTQILQRYMSRARAEVSEWGFGRIDALGRGSNTLYGNLHPDNLRYMNAPVNMPPLWNVQLYDWVQWSGSIQNPRARNIAQIIGIGAGLFEDQKNRFRSSLDSNKLERLEELANTIKPPVWPGEVFGDIEIAKAEKGKLLYLARCAHCHVPATKKTPNTFKHQYEMVMVPIEEIGSDPTYLDNFAGRRVWTGPLGKHFGAPWLPSVKITERVTTDLLRSTGHHETNLWSADARFMARPNAAIWATPPYLHNGSVPNVYQLLGPREARSRCFFLGDLTYDPAHLGYTHHPCSETARASGSNPDFLFDTTRTGNSNSGHELRSDVPLRTGDATGADRRHTLTAEECRILHKERNGWAKLHKQYVMNGVVGCGLTDEERLQIIEYLKTCDLDDVNVNRNSVPRVCSFSVAVHRRG
jgi:hypothetical protein